MTSPEESVGKELAEKTESYVRSRLRSVWQNRLAMRLVAKRFLTLEETEYTLKESRNPLEHSTMFTVTKFDWLVCKPKFLAPIFFRGKTK